MRTLCDHFAHTNGIWADDDLDHKDGNDHNNKIINLREANRSQQMMNLKTRETNTSGITGVSWNDSKKKWHVRIKKLYIGYFAEFDNAVTARHAAEDEYFGEFAARHSRSPQPSGPDLFAVERS